jgi:hypothetical protein
MNPASYVLIQLMVVENIGLFRLSIALYTSC